MSPEERARAAHQRLIALNLETRALEAERSQAVNELRSAGWTYGQIAALLGISRSRAHQLAPQRHSEP